MSYYKKSELTNLFGVNPRTISRWIQNSREGGLGLELVHNDGRYFIAKTARNQQIIQKLLETRRKYLNGNIHKVIKPLPEFYNVYTEEQIHEIFTQIDTDREIPHKYAYFDGGAESWDEYARKMHEGEVANTLTSTINLLDLNMSYLDSLLEEYDLVNIIDVGVGNALSSKSVVNHLLEKNKLNRYVAIDISPTMLDIAKRNIKNWFGDHVKFEGYCYDISVEPFANIIAEPPSGAVNLILLLGGTLSNFNTPQYALDVIRKSMQRNDLFLYSLKLDSRNTRDQFNSATQLGNILPPHREYVIDLLGINKSLYDIVLSYDEIERARVMHIKLKYALTIEMQVMSQIWKIELNKGDSLAVWRAKHYSHFEIEKLIYGAGFNPLHKSRTKDNDFLLLISGKRPLAEV
ncbi:MAG TPA: L-histidine N(alpha)-methyltransferase [Verrucomicrobiae bacterium]|nr:L-histidine N(alpha)-methyltransferase [Verrucomicrobiae bacterium]